MGRATRIEFNASPRPTLGVEWEVVLVDRRTRDLASSAAEVMAAVELPGHPSGPRVTKELLRNTLEIVTGVCDTVAQATEDLTTSLAAIRRVSDAMGLDVMCAGTHPFGVFDNQLVSDDARYVELLERTQWWGRQLLIWGVHVHVGVDSVHKVLPILNSLLNHYPHLQALSASSPYWAGHDTGFASNRSQMFQQLPTAGLPFQFATWAQFEGYVDDMLVTGVIDGLPDVRWDVRPSPRLGTIEVRVCDGTPTLRELRAVTALVHCLVVHLDGELEAGRELPTMPPWHVQENKWRSARYGLDAEIIVDAAGRERLVTDDLDDWLTRLEPVARRLRCEEELRLVAEIPRRGASYQRQRAAFSAARDAGSEQPLVDVVDSLVAEMREG
ncbi:glutamate--cysteine ligase [Kineococcus esterisolvens]|uniref:glutamate--cysteine ligase n=1 Tax=unclassified Kineococcus TaxID=2621656 RepID=UPI003D7E1599